MATWFATAGGNINSAGRWNSAPDGSGSTLTWPPAQGDVLVANGKTITVNVSVDLGSTGELRSDTTGGATQNGVFNATATGLTITANVIAPATGSSARTLYWGGAGTLTLVGNYTGSNPTSGTYALYTISGTVNLTGSVTGGTSTNGRCIYMALAATINVTGNVMADVGPAIINNAPCNVTVTGNVIAGQNTAISGSGNATITGYAQASDTAAALTAGTADGYVFTVGETRSAPNGRGAVEGAFRYASATAAKSQPIINGSQQTLSVLDVAALVPDEADVRAGVTYGDGAYTGTLAASRKRLSMAGRF